jgi:superfamily II DNA or RNA helicase
MDSKKHDSIEHKDRYGKKPFESIRVNSWFYSLQHHCPCKVIQTQSIWDQTVYRVWLAKTNAVERIPASQLKPIDAADITTPDTISYCAAAAKVSDALTHDALIAPIDASVIPLPHQIRALSQAMHGDRIRYLLADEVGLGKTIEAGLILRELKLRGLVKRVLVVAPKGLVTQWVAEMETHFNEEFQLLIPGDFQAYRRFSGKDNIWQSFERVVVPMDSVKPMDSRRGWSVEQVAEYNQRRFEDLVQAGWDLVIVDEAHRLGGSTDQVARFRLGQGLADAAPYFLMLSATPHQGKTDAFHRLVSLLDEQAFPDIESVSRDLVQPYVIRTEKRQAINSEGQPLFKPRRTELLTIAWEDRHRQQQSLYDAVTEYVREGYNQAMLEKRSYIGFLMILMQRLVVSSTSAIKTTLTRRLDSLKAPQEQLTLFPMHEEDDWADLDGQGQVDVLLTTRLKALKNEHAEVKLLLSAASECEQSCTDAKAEALLDSIYRLQAEEGDADLKVLAFTEFVPTQGMLSRFLSDRGFSVVCLNGSLSMLQRKEVQEAFANEARVLISTDAGGEGLNLQFCHVVINYDMPWNPMRLEQRIGRVDRIGQTHAVRAINLVLEGSVECRVREVLETKLGVILEEFGVDKTGDVLDSAQAGEIFDHLYMDAVLNPERIETSVQDVVNRIQEAAHERQQSTNVLGEAESLDPTESQRLMTHPLPHWIERMTVTYVNGHGGEALKKGKSWNITWPDGHRMEKVVFNAREAERNAAAKLLTLENRRVRELMEKLPRFAPGQAIPRVSMQELSSDVQGFWSVWEISIQSEESSSSCIMPLFVNHERRVFIPTAHHIWNQLLTANPQIDSFLTGEDSEIGYAQLLETAKQQGENAFNDLIQAHRNRVTRQQEKSDQAFASRRRAIERIGLPQVRSFRVGKLEREALEFREHLERANQVLPELTPLIIIHIGSREQS